MFFKNWLEIHNFRIRRTVIWLHRLRYVVSAFAGTVVLKKMPF